MSLWKNLPRFMKSKNTAAVCFTHIGKRLNHEDNFLFYGRYLTCDMQRKMPDCCCVHITEDMKSEYGVHLFAVSDGMGGHNAGEMASRICVERLAEEEKKIQGCSSVREVMLRLQSEIAEINTAVCEMGRRDRKLKGMGATLVVFAVCGRKYGVLNIGDSRAYAYIGNTLTQITKDNTEGQRMLDLGLLTRKELDAFPAKKNLSRYIGYDRNGFVLEADEYYPALGKGTLLLCSDGISDFLSEDRISAILGAEDRLEDAAGRLMEEAVSTYNADNATVILIPLGR